MILYPAIDVRGGRAVRLVQGDYGRETSFDDDPLDAARRWVDGGASVLHVVDLEGARRGEPVALDDVRRIASSVGVPVQVGGGIRTPEAARRALEAGAARVVLGTVAQRDPELVARLVDEHGPDRIVVGIDVRDGAVAVEGWTESTGTLADGLVRDLGWRGARRFVFTPVEVDGTLEGPGIAQLRALEPAIEAAGGEVVYSGGVGSLADLRALAGSAIAPLAGVIVGRALYEGRFTVPDALEALAGS